MSIVKFKKSELLNTFKGLPDSMEVYLVGDHGVYIMPDKRGENPVAYAVGINPDVDEFDDWWEKKRRTFGADDGGDVIGNVGSLRKWVESHPKEFIRVSLTKNLIKILGA